MIATLRLLYRLSLLAMLFTGGYGIAIVVFPLLKKVRPQLEARHLCNRLKQQWIKGFGRIVNLQVEVQGDAPQQPVLLVGNHISWLDILAVGQTAPGHFVAKSDILSWPVIGYLSAQAEAIFIRRGDKNHIRAVGEQMAGLLHQNCNLFVFPEGTTTRGDSVLPFHTSLIYPALQTHSPVQPFSLQYCGESKRHAPYVDDDVFLLHLLQILKLPRVDVKLTFHPPIDTRNQTRHAISQAAMQIISQQINPMPTPIAEAQAC